MKWNEFVKGKMAGYMKSEGSHKKAMERLSKEWKELKGKESLKKKEVKTKKVVKKPLKELLKGSNCEKIEATVRIISNLMRKKESDKKKIKAISNRASYIYNGLREKCDKEAEKVAIKHIQSNWGVLKKQDDRRIKKQDFTVPESTQKLFDKLIELFGVKPQVKKKIELLPDKLF